MGLFFLVALSPLPLTLLVTTMAASNTDLAPPYQSPPAAQSQGELAERQYVSRPAPADLAYPAFHPLSLSSSSSAHLTASLHVSLDRGIYTVPAFGADPPPPFPQHDISAQDWAQFWAAMKRAADLPPAQGGRVPYERR